MIRECDVRCRAGAPFLGWPELGVVPLVVFTMLMHPLGEYLPVEVGTLRVEWIDIGLLVVIGTACLSMVVRPLQLDMPAAAGALVVLSIVLIYPIFLGLADGRDVESVLRAGRVAAYYASVPLLWQLVWNHRSARNLLLLISWLAGVAAGYALLSHAMGWEWRNAMSVWVLEGEVISRGYGWWSAMPWYPYGAIIAISYAWASDASRARRWAMGALGGCLVLATLSTYIRGDFVGLALGLLTVGSLGSRSWDRLALLWRRLRTAVPVWALVLGAVLIATWSVTGTMARLVIVRVVSVIDTQAYEGSGAGTRADRLLAMQHGLRYAWDHWLGIGYGTPTDGLTREWDRITYWAAHNSLSWMGYYLGLAGLLVALLLLAVVGWSLLSLARRQGEWATLATAGVFTAYVGQSLASTVFFSAMYQYPLVPVLVVIGLRLAVDDEPEWLPGWLPGRLLAK